MPKLLTETTNFTQKMVAYWINSTVSNQVAQVIAELQAALKEQFNDAVLYVPRESLHISLNALSPFYFDDEISNAPAEVSSEFITAVKNLFQDQHPIKLHFDAIEVSPSAITLKAQDDGTFNAMRYQIKNIIALPEGTKPSPNIIHTSICRFQNQIDVEMIQGFLSDKNINVEMTVSEFRILREKIFYMIDFDVLQRFKLIPPNKTYSRIVSR